MSKVYYKSPEEVELIRESSLLVSKTLAEVAKIIAPGVTTMQLNKLAETYIQDNGAIPAFLNYNGFPYSLCISPNEQVVHGFPGDYVIQEGDLISVDCGVIKNNFFGDSAYTFSIGEISPERQKLVDITQECLKRAIDKAVVGSRIGDVGFAVQSLAEENGFGVVRELVGHGVGVKLHEKPEVPNYGKRGTGMKLEEGMVIAIEPMINAGTANVKFWSDGWTVTSRDNSPSAHFEHTIAVKKGKADVLSTFSFIEEVLKEKR
ncbi:MULTISPECIES: type I methionyl aminopeptidase [Pedobacter]|uniref:Methionine aminopeptidase n=1 Tax=Pedobacter cryoconitis TaxID=188932 RepID=A0A327SYG7_9SPHI|nr:type I methionyl aminopeptidase [Pedobacter cryoconitis]MBB5619828.1 methionyl aminopeptidase [Pedobacter cryoconitis]MBB5647976.1 methionyl aminopeptidase [Pedobacter cryoconitis]QNK62274.1 type I methionyl aminopeptidase [Pedobacter sp. PAMC26386]RAJ30557.1 methionyl aminopeptidase [Pedobacter cryoconitis]